MIMESVINWQTGEPKESGRYIVTECDGHVTTINFQPKELVDVDYFNSVVKAWCKLSDIEPYKEDNWTKFNEGEIVR